MEGMCSRLFFEKYDHRQVHVHIHIHNYVHIHLQKYMYIYMCVFAVGWLVVWCGVVWCVVVVVSLSLVFSNLKLVTEAVFSIVRWIYGRKHDDTMNDLDVNMAFWGIFLNATLRATVHLGQDYEANLRYVRNNLWDSVGLLFCETGKLISEHEKSLVSVSTIIFKYATWMSTSSLYEKAYQFTNATNAKTYIFSDSVLCVGKMGYDPVATWKNKIEWYSGKLFQGYESNRRDTDGVRVENIPKNHNVVPPRAHSKSNDRHTV